MPTTLEFALLSREDELDEGPWELMVRSEANEGCWEGLGRRCAVSRGLGPGESVRGLGRMSEGPVLTSRRQRSSRKSWKLEEVDGVQVRLGVSGEPAQALRDFKLRQSSNPLRHSADKTLQPNRLAPLLYPSLLSKTPWSVISIALLPAQSSLPIQLTLYIPAASCTTTSPSLTDPAPAPSRASTPSRSRWPRPSSR